MEVSGCLASESARSSWEAASAFARAPAEALRSRWSYRFRVRSTRFRRQFYICCRTTLVTNFRLKAGLRTVLMEL